MSRRKPLERPQSLTELAIERIRDEIITGRIDLGEQFSEAQLAAQMQVSKTPIREALVQLKVEGLVEIHPQRGSFVFELNEEQVRHLCTFRTMIETSALRDAMRCDTSPLLSDLKELVIEMKRAEKAKALHELAALDMSFHYTFLKHCPSAYLKSAYELVWYQLSALRHRSPISNAVESHTTLIEAIKSGNSNIACKLLADHIGENEPRYLKACHQLSKTDD